MYTEREERENVCNASPQTQPVPAQHLPPAQGGRAHGVHSYLPGPSHCISTYLHADRDANDTTSVITQGNVTNNSRVTQQDKQYLEYSLNKLFSFQGPFKKLHYTTYSVLLNLLFFKLYIDCELF